MSTFLSRPQLVSGILAAALGATGCILAATTTRRDWVYSLTLGEHVREQQPGTGGVDDMIAMVVLIGIFAAMHTARPLRLVVFEAQ